MEINYYYKRSQYQTVRSYGSFASDSSGPSRIGNYGALEEKANYKQPWVSMPFQPEHPKYRRDPFEPMYEVHLPGSNAYGRSRRQTGFYPG